MSKIPNSPFKVCLNLNMCKNDLQYRKCMLMYACALDCLFLLDTGGSAGGCWIPLKQCMLEQLPSQFPMVPRYGPEEYITIFIKKISFMFVTCIWFISLSFCLLLVCSVFIWCILFVGLLLKMLISLFECNHEDGQTWRFLESAIGPILAAILIHNSLLLQISGCAVIVSYNQRLNTEIFPYTNSP